jgi:hypothetical protein
VEFQQSVARPAVVHSTDLASDAAYRALHVGTSGVNRREYFCAHRATRLRHSRDIPATKRALIFFTSCDHFRELRSCAVAKQPDDRFTKITRLSAIFATHAEYLARSKLGTRQTCPRQACPSSQECQRAFAAVHAFECIRTFSRSDYARRRRQRQLGLRHLLPLAKQVTRARQMSCGRSE